MNPYDSPEASTSSPVGEMDVRVGLFDAVSAIGRNFLSLIGTGVSFSVVYLFSCCTLVGWIAVIPWMYWAYTRWALDAIDGKASVFTCVRDVQEDPATTLLRGWGAILVIMGAMIPALVVSVGVSLVVQGASVEQVAAASLVSHGLVGTYSALVLSRLGLTWLFLTDRRETLAGALAASVEATRGRWIPLAGLTLLAYLVGTPGAVGGSVIGALASDPELLASMVSLDQLWGAIFGFYGLLLVFTLLQTLVYAVVYVTYAAVFRQLYPTPPEVQV